MNYVKNSCCIKYTIQDLSSAVAGLSFLRNRDFFTPVNKPVDNFTGFSTVKNQFCLTNSIKKEGEKKRNI
jgi:hypothetical protein